MNHRIKAGIHYLRRTFDEAAILAIAAKLAFDPDPHFSESELAVIAAMQRAHPSAGGDPKTLGHWLAEMNERQIEGVISNTKGVLHEMEFVRIENEDGDSVHAALYPDTNHPDTDVVFVDDATGLSWDVQLKATSDVSYVQDWIDNTMVFAEVDDVDSFWDHLQTLDLTAYPNARLQPIRHENWGSECFVHDPSGVLWHFGSFKK